MLKRGVVPAFGGRMDRIIRSIHHAARASDLLSFLKTLLGETERIVILHPLTAKEAHLLAKLLTEIRFLLTRLARAGIGAEKEDGAIAVERLAALYEAVEGRVKEMRNDLAGRRSGPPPRSE